MTPDPAPLGDDEAAKQRSHVGFAADYEDARFLFVQVRANVGLNAPWRHAEMTRNQELGGWVLEIVDGVGEYALPCRHCGSVGLEGDDHTCMCPNTDATCTVHVGSKAFR